VKATIFGPGNLKDQTAFFFELVGTKNKIFDRVYVKTIEVYMCVYIYIYNPIIKFTETIE
jgi:hypothetical protein